MGTPLFLQRLQATHRPWLACLLTFLCPGWGQIYNRDLRWLLITFVTEAVLAVCTVFFLFDSLAEIALSLVLGLALSLALSAQAFVRARRIRNGVDTGRWDPWSRLGPVPVFFLAYVPYAIVLFGIPEGYGLFMPSRVKSFQIPSESMVPNLLIGDRLVADGWAYWGKEPSRGDVVVFDYPRDPSIKFVKRLVGLPGDVIEFKAGELWLNGQIVPQRRAQVFPEEASKRRATEFLETLGGKEHVIHRAYLNSTGNLGPITVPEGKYFMLGDNRDHSSDSRFWGFVSRDQIIGRMAYIYFSWDKEAGRLRRDRIGKMVD